jgi:hypothetical protein
MIVNLYDRIKAGETINVEVPETCNVFTIEPARSQLLNGAIIGYSILVDGEVVPGHKGTLMDRETIDAWAVDLTEVDNIFDEADGYFNASRGVA